MKAFGALVGLLASTPLLAADFDGNKNLICAPAEVHDCTTDGDCVSGSPRKMGAPRFMRVDFSKKMIVGPRRTAPFRQVDANEEQVILQGTEEGYGFTLVLDKTTGDFSISLTDRLGAFVLFGSCTPT
jgi:hypothetical protein